jgi:uncharacterized protein (DUF2141 family)
MNPRRALVVAVALTAALLVPACAAPAVLPARPEGAGSLMVRVTGFARLQGQLLVNVFVTSDGFPGDHDRALRTLQLPIDGDVLTASFADVPAGPVAVSAFHDEDMDFALDSNLLGIPTERWGVSGGARGLLGPPEFTDCRLQLAPGQRLGVEIVVR